MNLNFFRFAANEDKLTEASNKIALILASNTPFYPLYLYFILGHAGVPVIFFSAISLPFFIATIPIARRNGLSGRIWISVMATLNSAYVTWLLGEPSGTALFLIPCISLAVLSFRSREYFAMGVTTALPFVLYYLLHNHFPAPPAVYSEAAYHSLVTLNTVSVASITAVLGYIFGAAHERLKS